MNTSTAGVAIALGIIAIIVGLLAQFTTIIGTHHTLPTYAYIAGVILIIIGIGIMFAARSRTRL